MVSRKGQAQVAAEVSVLIFLIGLFMLGYIILLPEENRNELLGIGGGEEGQEEEDVAGAETILSVAPGLLSTSKSAVTTVTLDPIHLYSSTESNTEVLLSSMLVSRSVIQNNYKQVSFDVDKDALESLSLLFLVTESKGNLIIELNGNVVYEGDASSAQLPLVLPLSELVEEGNLLKFYTDSPGWNIFSTHHYTLQDIQLVEDFTVADTTATRTLGVVEPSDIKAASLSYFVTCNSDEDGVLGISLNGREVFSDRVFCSYRTKRSLSLDPSSLSSTNTLLFEITEGDYHLDQLNVQLTRKERAYPSYQFELDEELYNSLALGEKDLVLKLSFADVASHETLVLINEYSFRVDTSATSYEKDISNFVSQGSNVITLQPENSFELDNLKVSVVA